MSLWSEEEINILLEKFPEYARKGKPQYSLTDVLPDRSANAIDHKLRDLRSKGAVGSYSDYYVDPEDLEVSNQIKAKIKDGEMVVESPRSDRVRTLEDLLEMAQIDEDVWQVERHIINKWEVGTKDPETGDVTISPLIQVKAWLKPNFGMQSALAAARQAVLDKVSENAPVEPSVHENRQGKLMVEFGLFDVHLGQYSSEEQTGVGYSLDIAERDYKFALLDLIQKVSSYTSEWKDVEEIIFPIGNDFIHFDHSRQKTSSGKVEIGYLSDGAIWQEVVRRAFTLLRWSVDTLKGRAPVKVIVVPGNHDAQASWYLGEILDAWYRNSDDVLIDNGPTARKYHNFGKVLIGFAHGQKEKRDKLPMTMATEVPELWGKSSYRAVHIGHRHFREAVKFIPLSDDEGVTVRMLPSLAPPDTWHHNRAYSSVVRAAEAYVYDKEQGLAASFLTSIQTS